MKYYLSVILFFVFFNSYSQNKSLIFGKVVDEKTGDILSGVFINVENTNLKTKTDINGYFKIVVDTGSYTIIFKFLNYKTKTINNVVLKSGGEIYLDILLEQTSVELTGVVVQNKNKKESISSLLIIQKNLPSVSDVISIENIKKTPDRSVADVLKRVNGVSVQDNKFVIVRGLSDRYNTAYLNNSPLPSTESDRKTFSFDFLPSSIVDNILITKTATPDKPGEFAGGIIEITTRDIPEKKLLQIQYGSNYHTISTFKPYSTYQGGKTDWLGIDDGNRKLPSNFPNSYDYARKSIQQQIDITKTITDSWEITQKNKLPLGNSFSLIFGTPFKIQSKEFGVFLGLNYTNQNRFIQVQRSDYDLTGMVFNYNDSTFRTNINESFIFNFSAKLNSTNKLSLKNVVSINSDNQLTLRNGTDYTSGNYIKSYAYIFNQNILTSSQLNGDHVWATSKLKLNWNLGYCLINRQTPDYRRLKYIMPTPENQNPDNPQDYWQAFLTPSASPNDGGKFYSTLNERILNSSINLTKTFKGKRIRTDVKIGGQYTKREREFTARVLGYITNPQFNYNILCQDIGDIFSQSNITPKGLRLSESTNPDDQYTAGGELIAGYLMFDQRVNDKFRFVYGVRMESYKQTLKSKDYTNKPIEINTTKNDILPSLNFTYLINKKVNLKLSASQTLSRPEFRELAPFSFFDFNQFVSMQGNSKIQRTLIQNYDFRYEFFIKDGEMISTSLFYKNFINPIEIVLDPAIGGGTRNMTYQNIPHAMVKGIEFEIRKRLPELNHFKWLKYITITSNLSWIVSRVDISNMNGTGRTYRPLQGQSPYIVNLLLNYQNKGWYINISYNLVGPRITNVGTKNYLEYYEKQRHIIDLQLGKTFKKDKIDLKLNIGDLLSQSLIIYQPSVNTTTFENSNIINSFRNGKSITLSCSWKL